MGLLNSNKFSALIYNPYIFSTQCLKPYIFQTMNSARSNNLSLAQIYGLENLSL